MGRRSGRARRSSPRPSPLASQTAPSLSNRLSRAPPFSRRDPDSSQRALSSRACVELFCFFEEKRRRKRYACAGATPGGERSATISAISALSALSRTTRLTPIAPFGHLSSPELGAAFGVFDALDDSRDHLFEPAAAAANAAALAAAHADSPQQDHHQHAQPQRDAPFCRKPRALTAAAAVAQASSSAASTSSHPQQQHHMRVNTMHQPLAKQSLEDEPQPNANNYPPSRKPHPSSFKEHRARSHRGGPHNNAAFFAPSSQTGLYYSNMPPPLSPPPLTSIFARGPSGNSPRRANDAVHYRDSKPHLPPPPALCPPPAARRPAHDRPTAAAAPALILFEALSAGEGAARNLSPLTTGAHTQRLSLSFNARVTQVRVDIWSREVLEQFRF